MDNKDELLDTFNEVLTDFANNLAYIAPTSIIGNNIKEINKIIKNRVHRELFINKFILNVLVFKNKIDKNDESFFLGDNFTKRVLDHKEIKEAATDEKTIMSKIFELKSIWGTLSSANKSIIFEYMQTLCNIAQEYFILCDV